MIGSLKGVVDQISPPNLVVVDVGGGGLPGALSD